MFSIPLAFVLLFPAPQLPAPPASDPVLRQHAPEEARQNYELMRQAALHLNDLAGDIHSEADARTFVDAVAERFLGNENLSWTTRPIRYRVAHAENEAVSDPARLIPEQRIVDIWNEYVRELDAPEETLVTVAEVHNLRDATYTLSHSMWNKGIMQQLWTVPNIYAVGADGKVASGCRAVEALKIFHDMFYFFQNVQRARERVQKGILVSDLATHGKQQTADHPRAVSSQLVASARPNPVLSAEIRYVQAHGEGDYQRLLERLYAELFPEK